MSCEEGRGSQECGNIRLLADSPIASVIITPICIAAAAVAAVVITARSVAAAISSTIAVLIVVATFIPVTLCIVVAPAVAAPVARVA